MFNGFLQLLFNASSSLTCDLGVLVDSLLGLGILEETFWKKWNLQLKKLEPHFPTWIPVRANYAAITSRLEFTRKSVFEKEEYVKQTDSICKSEKYHFAVIWPNSLSMPSLSLLVAANHSRAWFSTPCARACRACEWFQEARSSVMPPTNWRAS